ncbi:POTRA domain-containing protein [Rasiella sp. SM2506]|uniref:POTRA domain-containing protein n=1 Tax=Rasiella sp. SM2506 TaxID=3423914 RepID=UPI003D78C067
MKQIFYVFLYLNIYTLLNQGAFAQQLYLEIEAEKPISESLRDSLLSQPKFKDFLSLKAGADSLVHKLYRLGFIDAKNKSLEKKNDSSYIANYFLGPKYKLIKVFYSDSSFSKKQLRQISEEVEDNYFILNFETAEASLQKLNNLQTETGNTFARLKLTKVETKDTFVTATLGTQGKSFRILDSIVIKGYDKFPRSFLKYYAGIKTGKTFNRNKLLQQNSVIDNLGFANTTKAPEVLFRKESTTAYFYIEKQNNNLFDGILGFATDEETQRLQLNGYLNLELNNNLNFGEQLLINYKADGNEQVNFRAKAKMPYLLKSPFGISLELNIFKRDSTFVTTQQEAQVTYQVNTISSVYIGYKGYESSNLLDEAIAGIAVEDYNASFLTAGGIVIIPQNSKLFPKKTELQLGSEFGKRESKGLQENQTRLSALANHIFNINENNSLYLQNSSSILFSETYFTNELFRFGGINSIRGFNENSIDASLFSVLNTEYRYILNPGLYVHSIIDLGYFENKPVDVKEKLYSFGLGIGLQTKGGILRFNIANGSSENQSFRFSNTKIHLSLSSQF